MSIEQLLAEGKFLEAGKILFDAAPSKSNWAAAVLEHCITVTNLDLDIFREVLGTSSLRAKFSNIRKLTRELEINEIVSPQKDALRCMCYVAENVAKVRANEIENAGFDEDSGHWLLKNVIDVLTRLGSHNATTEAIAILVKTS